MPTPIYLCSYKGTLPGWHGIVNRGIRFATTSTYSHSEIAVGNPFGAAVMCVSSSGVDGGVRAKTLQMSPDKWDVLPLPWVTEGDVVGFIAKYKGEPYDFAGTGRFVLPFFLREHDKAWFCSEAAAQICGFAEPWRFDPATLHAAVATVLALQPTQ
jgi:hypothetical protein